MQGLRLSFMNCGPFNVSLNQTLHICHRGLHSSDQSVQTRVFYLFHRFIKENRNEISPELSGTLLNGIRDLLNVQVEIPELENPETDDVLSEATKHTGIFDAQLYLFETVGTLLSAFMRSPEEASSLLQSVATPLLDDLSVNLQAIKGPQDVVPVLKVHHTIMALGNIAKGFPDYPTTPTKENTPPLDVFRTVAQAILVSLEAMNVFKVVRDAVSDFFSRSELDLGIDLVQLDKIRLREDFGDDRSDRHATHSDPDVEPSCSLRAQRTGRFYQLHRPPHP